MASPNPEKQAAARIEELLRQVKDFGEAVREHLEAQRENNSFLDHVLALRDSSKAPKDRAAYKQDYKRRSDEQRRLNAEWEPMEKRIYEAAGRAHVCFQLARFDFPPIEPIFKEMDRYYDRIVLKEDGESEPRGKTAMWDILVQTRRFLERACEAAGSLAKERPSGEEKPRLPNSTAGLEPPPNKKSVPIPPAVRERLLAVVKGTPQRKRMSKAAVCRGINITPKTLKRIVEGEDCVSYTTLRETEEWLDREFPAEENPQ